MKTVSDYLHRSMTYTYPPKRIISLSPAITETMYHLQLHDEIVGRTRFCIYPKDHVNDAVKVGGTKDIKLEAIDQLKPDIIIAEKEENTKEIIKTLEKHYPVYVFEIQTIDDALHMIQDLGRLTDRETLAADLTSEIVTQFQTLPEVDHVRVAYVIWRNPYMVVGKDTYIQSVLDKMGFINPFTSFTGRYPLVSEEDFQKAELDYVFLATEPYRFQAKHFEEFSNMMPHVQPLLVDGEMFWYGAKMIKAATYFRNTFSSF
ncbi:MAG TPA: helical backbone metal receptor [Bacillota bacterium]